MAALVVAAVAALAGGLALVDAVGEQIIAGRQRAVAEAARDYFVAFAHQEGLQPLATALDQRERLHRAEAFRYAVFSREGDFVGGARLLSWSRLPGAGVSQVEIAGPGGRTAWQVLVQPIATGGTLVVYEDLSERAAFRQALALGAALALAIALGGLLGVSLWLTRLMYARAESIARTAGDIAEGRASARVATAPDGDVFDRLGESLNAMLDRNDELMTGLRTVTDSLAHDLRTPLTRMKGALSRALDTEAPSAAREVAIGEALEQADQALATTGALLDIARAETGLSRDMLQPVDLSALVEDVAELFAPTVEDAGQSLKVELPSSPVRLEAHEVLVRQAVGNLIYNAARYAGAGAEVTVSVDADGGQVRCVVADTGPGIAEADRGRVVERFVRLDPARTAAGSGLGLAIAAACAKLHGGTLVLEDNAPGLRVVLQMHRR